MTVIPFFRFRLAAELPPYTAAPMFSRALIVSYKDLWFLINVHTGTTNRNARREAVRVLGEGVKPKVTQACALLSCPLGHSSTQRAAVSSPDSTIETHHDKGAQSVSWWSPVGHNLYCCSEVGVLLCVWRQRMLGILLLEIGECMLVSVAKLLELSYIVT